MGEDKGINRKWQRENGKERERMRKI
jgi:hypothetical protein